jgi:hypothetical protein
MTSLSDGRCRSGEKSRRAVAAASFCIGAIVAQRSCRGVAPAFQSFFIPSP